MPAELESAPFDWKNPDYEPIYARRAMWLERIRHDPERAEKDKILPGLKDHYRDNPVDFITDWGMTFDPRNVEIGLPAIVPFVLFPKQEEYIDWLHAHWRGRKDGLTEKSRDMGCTWLCAGFAVWMWLFHAESVVGFGSRKEEYVDKIGDPKSIFWKVRAFVNLLPVELRPAGYVEARHAPHMRVINPENGATILGEAGDNIGRGNRTSIYFKDESAFYEHAALIDAALSQTSNCKIDVSTPNGPGNPFYQKRHGGRLDVFTFHWKDDPRKGPAWYEKQKHDLDAVILAQEVDIDYEASQGDAFISGDLVTSAQAHGPATVPANGFIQFGVDVARFGDDKSCITCRKGRVVLWQKEYSKIDTMSLAGRVETEARAFPEGEVAQIAVDVIGVGSGVADYLRMRFPAKGDQPSIVVDVNASLRVDDGINFNLRAQMYDNGREWLKMQPCSLPNEAELKAELCAPKYYFRGGLRLIEDKADMKKRGIKSPNRADSLMLTFAIPMVAPVKPLPYTPTWKPQDPGLGL